MLSLATGCMNRAANLRIALASWLACPEIDEVIIVDWSSEVAVHKDLGDITDERVRFIRVEGQPYWCAARCHNVEITAASGDAILRIDSDVQVDPAFFNQHSLAQEDLFWNASWKNSCGDDCHLYGTVYTKRKNLLLVNGYNERLQSYGFEDEDIYQRMLKANLQRAEANRTLLKHIPHDMTSRLCHLNPDFKVVTAIEGVGVNLRIAEAQPWDESDRMTSWSIVQADRNLWIYTNRD